MTDITEGRLPHETAIEELEFPIGIYNALKRSNIHTLGDLLGKSEAELLDILNPRHARQHLDQIKEKLCVLGYSLAS